MLQQAYDRLSHHSLFIGDSSENLQQKNNSIQAVFLGQRLQLASFHQTTFLFVMSFFALNTRQFMSELFYCYPTRFSKTRAYKYISTFSIPLSISILNNY